MKERKTAEQAYISAMNKMIMPAQIDLDKKIISTGSGRIRMKSKALAYVAAAAVLALCIAVGAVVMFNKNDESTPKVGSSKDMTLEEDQTIPSGEIKSVEQAVEEHQKCMLLENDEYIKLKANRENITKEMAQSFAERTEKLTERDKQCTDYIEKNDNSEQVRFVHAVLYDDGEMSISYHFSDNISDELKKVLYNDFDGGFCIYDARTNERLLSCSNKVDSEYKSNDGWTLYSFGDSGHRIPKSDRSKLRGELSLIAEKNKNTGDNITVIRSFRFFEKLFIGLDERIKLKQLADKAMDDLPLSINNVDLDSSAHGIVVRFIAKPNNEKGAELIHKYGKKDEGGKCDIVPGSEDNSDYQPIVVVGNDGTYYTGPDEHFQVIDSSTEKGSEYICYVCYIPLRNTPPKRVEFVVYLKVLSSEMSDKEIENGKWRNETVGKIKLVYDPAYPEKIYKAPSGRKIILNDIYFTIPDNSDDKCLTMKYSNGTQKSVYNAELYKGYLNENINPFEKDYSPTVRDDDFHAIFFKDIINTDEVTSVFYAGEEYKLVR